jgi:hypothetical protein
MQPNRWASPKWIYYGPIGKRSLAPLPSETLEEMENAYSALEEIDQNDVENEAAHALTPHSPKF